MLPRTCGMPTWMSWWAHSFSAVLSSYSLLRNGLAGNPSISLATSPALAGAPTAPTPPTEDNSTRIATTAWVRATQAPEPIWAGTTSFTNVRNTYANFPIGTKVAFLDTRTYSIGVGNGAATISDQFRRVVKKIDALTWVDVGG